MSTSGSEMVPVHDPYRTRWILLSVGLVLGLAAWVLWILLPNRGSEEWAHCLNRPLADCTLPAGYEPISRTKIPRYIQPVEKANSYAWSMQTKPDGPVMTYVVLGLDARDRVLRVEFHPIHAMP